LLANIAIRYLKYLHDSVKQCYLFDATLIDGGGDKLAIQTIVGDLFMTMMKLNYDNIKNNYDNNDNNTETITTDEYL